MKWTGRCTRQGLTRGRKTVGAVLSTQKPATARNAVVSMNPISISRRFEANEMSTSFMTGNFYPVDRYDSVRGMLLMVTLKVTVKVTS